MFVTEKYEFVDTKQNIHFKVTLYFEFLSVIVPLLFSSLDTITDYLLIWPFHFLTNGQFYQMQEISWDLDDGIAGFDRKQ